MRMIFGVLSLLAVLAVVAMLSNKQLKAVNNITVPSSNPVVGSSSGAVLPGASPEPAAGNVQQQSMQIQNQVKAALDAAAQPRVLPDEKP